MNKSNVGRPSLSNKKIDVIFRKLEPYLRAGLSLHKSCLVSGVPKSTAYDLKYGNDEFAEKIEIAKNYQSVLVASIVNKELETIQKKQKTKELNRDQIKFIQWVAINSRTTKEEFNRDGIEEKKDKTMQMIEDDPRVFNTMMKTYENMMNNLGYKVILDK